MTDTELDRAHAAMMSAVGDDVLRLRFYERLVESELFMVLAHEAQGDRISPEIFEVDGNRFVLAFDRHERLSEFAERIVPYVSLSGRALVAMLDGQGVGLALNPDVASSSTLLDAEALTWLAHTLQSAPTVTRARPVSLSAPSGVPKGLITGLDRKLALASGLAPSAYLAAATYEDGTAGHILTFVDAVAGAETALSSAMAEALAFSGVEAGALDVAFIKASDPLAARLARVGLRFDLPEPDHAAPPEPPGTDPSKPPIL